MRKIIYISLAAFVAGGFAEGCSPSLTAPQEPKVTNLLSYFWPDSTATYRYQVSSTGDVHTISVQQGSNIITDQEQDGDTVSNLSIIRSASDRSMSGFGSHDFLDFGSSVQVVQDTTAPIMHPEAIRSIAALNSHFGGSPALYAATDSVLYQVDLGTNTLTHPNSLRIHGLTLAEDQSGFGIYAYQYGGRGVFWTNNSGATWFGDSTPVGTAITAFTSSSSFDQFWVACGPQLFEFTYGNSSGILVPCGTLGDITALEVCPDGPSAGHILAGDADGNVFDVSQSKLVGTAPAGVLGIAGDYITTNGGIFNFYQSGSPLIAAGDSAIYSTGFSIFAARPDGSVDHFINPSQNANLSAPMAGVMVTQFAYPVQTPRDPNKGIYALAGGQIFYRTDSTHWSAPITPPASLVPGSLTLLRSDTGHWIAGYLESNHNGVQKGYGYLAQTIPPAPQVKFYDNGEETTFDDVLVVSYSSQSNGIADTTNVPQYTIYYKNGKGPIRIERTYNGKTIVTRLE